MTTAERDAVVALGDQPLTGNAKLFVARLALQLGSGDPELRPVDRGYLLRLARKHGLPVDGIQAAIDGETAVGSRQSAIDEEPAVDDSPSSRLPIAEARLPNAPMLYDAARKALAAARNVDEVKAIADKAEAVRIYAQRAGNRDMEIDAAEIRLRAERRLGEVLAELKAAEGLSEGGRPGKKTGADEEPVSGEVDKPTLADFGIDKKLSARAQKIAGVAETDFEARLATWRERLANDHTRVTVDILKSPPVNGGRSVMADRRESWESLDYAPTPPWATRALTAHVLPAIGVGRLGSVWDPGCGEGHITGVLEEVAAGPVTGTDIHDYSAGGRSPPGWWRVQDFLDADPALGLPACDWIVTNPPFKSAATEFVLRALDVAKVGVAMFVRLQWLETVDRYERIFRERPPTVIGFFVERVNLTMGRWQPEGGTATAYIWLAWKKGMDPRPPIWIPPGRRQALSLPSDAERFTAHPVLGRPEPATNITEIIPQSESRPAATSPADGPGEGAAEPVGKKAPPPDPEPGRDDDPGPPDQVGGQSGASLAIPTGLKRGHPDNAWAARNRRGGA